MAYPKEAVIAEKLQALTDLALLNSRLKDYFDLWPLSQLYHFQDSSLVEVFKRPSSTARPNIEVLPVGLTDAFALDPASKSNGWHFYAGVASRRQQCCRASFKRSANSCSRLCQQRHPVNPLRPLGDAEILGLEDFSSELIDRENRPEFRPMKAFAVLRR